jgi:hypothetical protein
MSVNPEAVKDARCHLRNALAACLDMWDNLNALERLVRRETGNEDFEYACEDAEGIAAVLRDKSELSNSAVQDILNAEIARVFDTDPEEQEVA